MRSSSDGMQENLKLAVQATTEIAAINTLAFEALNVRHIHSESNTPPCELVIILLGDG